MSNWLDPLNRIIWYNAFRKKATKVVLADGREFTVDYDFRPGTAYVRPLPKPGASSLVPTGFFNLKTVTDPIWLTAND